MDCDERCKRCGVKLGKEEPIMETLIRNKCGDIEVVHLCHYCTRALDNFLNCNWRFDHG